MPAKHGQPARWKIDIAVGHSEEAPDLHTAPAALPRWLLCLIDLVFFKASLYKGKAPVLRVFFRPRTGQAEAWIYRLWTPDALRRALVAAKLPITSGPQYGEAPCAGPCLAGSGLAVGKKHKALAILGVGVQWASGGPGLVST